MGENNPEDEFAELTSTKRWEEIIAKMAISVMTICTAFEIKTSRKITEEVLIAHIVKLKTKTEAIFASAGLRSPIPILIKKTAQRLRKTTTDQYSNISHRKMRHEYWHARIVISILQKEG